MRCRRRGSVELACWAHERGYLRLVWAIQIFWRVRNAIRYSDAAMWLSTKWLRLRYVFHPKCERCGLILFVPGSDYCFMCEIRRKVKVRQLRP